MLDDGVVQEVPQHSDPDAPATTAWWSSRQRSRSSGCESVMLAISPGHARCPRLGVHLRCGDRGRRMYVDYGGQRDARTLTR